MRVLIGKVEPNGVERVNHVQTHLEEGAKSVLGAREGEKRTGNAPEGSNMHRGRGAIINPINGFDRSHPGDTALLPSNPENLGPTKEAAENGRTARSTSSTK